MIDSEVAYSKFEKLFENNMSEDEAREFLITLYNQGESPEIIASGAKVMRDHSISLDIPTYLQERVIDVVGTGGDKIGSFNISSTVSLLLASMGSYVAKHGNRAITSNSGSADMLEKLGINLNLSLENSATLLEESGFTFMFAQNHHPAMKHIMPIRKSIPHRTIFNILGPLTNPAGVKKYLLGVFSKDFISPMADSLKLLGAKSAIVVSSRDGMDEISISDITYAKTIDGNEFIIDPEAFGFKLSPLEAIKGGDANTNADITINILASKEKGAKRDIVLLNTAAALVADKKARDMKDGIDMAVEAIDSFEAIKHLKKIIDTSKKLSS